tara:strand:+ start:7963 stop:8286 length:324 start_codon:yes stop_codon:yes gene_type:complete
MATLNLEQSGLIEFDLTSNGFTDSYEMGIANNNGVDLQLIRTTGTGNPLITFQSSNDGLNWANWEVEGYIFRDPNSMFAFSFTKRTFFRVSWLSNSSTGTFTANFNV